VIALRLHARSGVIHTKLAKNLKRNLPPLGS